MNRFFEAEVFLCVVDEGSFTAAARRLGVTTSYASKLVGRLEDRLGVRLLQRSTRRLALTEAGRLYHERCTGLMKTLEQAETEAADLQGSPRGRLRVALPSALGTLHLAKPLAELKARYPALTVEAIFSDERADLVGERFDVAIRAGELPGTSLVVKRLAASRRIVCASPSYLSARGAPKEPEALAEHECLRYAYHATPGTWRMEGPRGHVAVDVVGTLIANNGSALLEAAAYGLGIAFMPDFLASPFLRRGELVRVLPEWEACANIVALYPEARHVPAKVRVFVDFMAEKLRRRPW